MRSDSAAGNEAEFTHPITTHFIMPSMVFFFWIFVLHLPFELVGNCVAAGLKHFHAITVDEDLPWYKIDPILRVSTTVADVARIVFWVALGGRYEAVRNDTDGSNPLSPGMLRSEECSSAEGNRHQSTNHADYKSIDFINEPRPNSVHNPAGRSSILPNREWINLAFWSTLAWPLRMGDSFRLAGMYDHAWTPLVAYGVSRVAALAIGAIPGCIGGIPSLTTSLCLGLFYASRREQFERNVELLLAARVGKSGSDFDEDTLLENSIENTVRERNSSVVYRLRTILGYAYFTCFMVLWDAQIMNGALSNTPSKFEEK